MSAIGVRSLRSPSPRSHRIWGVHEVREDAPLALEALGERWSAELKEAISTAEILGIEPLELAGEPGLIGRARIDDGEVLVEWRAAVRGLWVIETVWEVDDQDLRHLEPLHRRLLASVTWAPPPELAEARAIVERNPRSRTGRLQLARALAETGDVQGSLAQYEALIAEEPRTPDIWSGLLALSGWYPAEVASADSIRERALAANPYPATLVDIVDSLEAAGQSDTATGLLELAWVRFPSDSKLRRARRTRGLPVDTLPESGLPRHLALGEDGRLDERTLHAWQERPLTLEQARLAGAEWRARREALTERLRRAVHASHEGAIEVLFLLRDGAPPDDPVAARAGLAEEMVSLELRGSLRWLPSEAATLLLGSDVQKALAAEVSEEG